MKSEPTGEETILEQALSFTSPEARRAYLQGACGGDQQLRARVESLIQAHEAAGGFLADKPAPIIETVRIESPAEESPGAVIGRYKLLQRVGEGGCGVVYAAEQQEPVRRRVALKVIKLGMDTKQVIARFEAERQALALMDHPNIAKVLDAGATETGRPFFVMELVRGIKLTDYCDQNNLPTRERLDLFIKVCQAIQHAHQKGIIHRDIKPSNILVTLHDGVPVPKVIDFGIAKATTDQRLTDKTLYTALEQFVGTPAYMSPEQAEMSGLDVDTRSDIYSLGVLLYELLIGKTPFDAKELLAAGLDEMRRTIREQEPVRPSTRLRTMLEGELTTTAKHRHTEAPRLVHLLKGDLDWVVLKALEKDRTRRYETANGLARDIQRHLNNEPVVARPPSTAYRAQKFVRRNKAMVTAAAVLLAVLVLGIVVSRWEAIMATRARRRAVQAEHKEAAQRQQADAARDQAQQAKQDAIHNLYIANLQLAQADYEQGNLKRFRELLEATRDDPNRGFEWYYWQRELHRDLKTFPPHLEPVRGVAISPDGKLVATAGMDNTAKLWDATTRREVTNFTFQRWARAVAFSPDGERLAIGGDDGKVVIRDLRRRLELLVITNRFQALVWSVAFSPDGTKLALGFSPDGTKPALGLPDPACSVIADAASGRTLRELKEPASGATNAPASANVVFCVAFSPDGQRLLTGDMAGIARIWDVETGVLVRRFEGRAGWICGGGFSPDGRQVVTAHDVGFVAKVWDVATTNVLHTLRGHQNEVTCAAFSPLGDRIYTTGFDQQIKVWDAVTGDELPSLPKSQSSGIMCMAVCRDGQHIVTGSWNGEATLWDAERTAGPRTMSFKLWPDGIDTTTGRFQGSMHGPVVFLKPDSDHGLAAAASPDYSVKILDFSSGRELLVLRGHTNKISSVCVSDDRRLIATASVDHTARIWDARSGQKLFALTGQTDKRPSFAWFASVAFSPDGRQLLASNGRGVTVWDTSNGSILRQLDVADDETVAAFSPDGNQIATAGDAGVTIWEAVSGRRRHTLAHPDGRVFALAWTRDGQRLATGGWGSTARLWDVASGRLLREFRGHRHLVWTVAFSPDDRRLLSGSQDHTAKLWEVATGRELLTLTGHTEPVTSASFADERRIITGSEDQTIKIWEAASPEEVANWEKEEEETTRRIEKLRNERAQAEARTNAPPAEGNK